MITLPVAIALQIVSGLLVIGACWGYLKLKIDSHVAEDERQFKAIWKWKDDHEADTANKREIIASRFGQLEGQARQQEDRHQENIKRFDRLEAKLDRLIEGQNKGGEL